MTDERMREAFFLRAGAEKNTTAPIYLFTPFQQALQGAVKLTPD
jgi:hypothetical protein